MRPPPNPKIRFGEALIVQARSLQFIIGEILLLGCSWTTHGLHQHIFARHNENCELVTQWAFETLELQDTLCFEQQFSGSYLPKETKYISIHMKHPNPRICFFFSQLIPKSVTINQTKSMKKLRPRKSMK